MDKKEEEPKEEEKKQKWYHKKQKHKHPNDDEQKQKQKQKQKQREKEKQQSTVKSKSKISKTSTTTSTTATSDTSFKPSSEVKGLKFGGQFIVKSFTIRRAGPLELLRLLSLPPPTGDHHHHSLRIFPSTVAFLPTNFTILAHHAWHTLTLGLGTNKSKVLITVFESESLRSFFADRIWPQEIPLGEVNRRILRGLAGCELARFKFRKGCLTFYVYAVRREGAAGFERAADLRAVLEAVVALRDFLDHTAMLAMPSQRSINYASSCNNNNNNNSTNTNMNCSASNDNSNSSAKQLSSAAKCSRPLPVAMAH